MEQYGVPGDPEGMRRLARALHKDADQLRDGKRDAKSTFKKHDARGDRPTLWKQRLYPALDALTGHAARLDQIAEQLTTAAHQVEVQIERARRAEQERLIKEAAARRERPQS